VDVTALLRPLPRHLPMVLFDAQVSPSPDNSDNTLEHIGTHWNTSWSTLSKHFLFTSCHGPTVRLPYPLDFSRIVGSFHFWRQHCTAHSKFEESPLSCGQTVRSHRFFQGLLSRLSPN
jgi:hypothetical protein